MRSLALPTAKLITERCFQIIRCFVLTLNLSTVFVQRFCSLKVLLAPNIVGTASRLAFGLLSLSACDSVQSGGFAVALAAVVAFGRLHPDLPLHVPLLHSASILQASRVIYNMTFCMRYLCSISLGRHMWGYPVL